MMMDKSPLIKLNDDPENMMGFIVDLQGYDFAEDQASWIQAMPLGSWQHPVHGEIKISLDRVQRFAANVNAGVRGQDLDIDYDHKEKRTDASGWIRQAEARTDGLWLLVDWTQEALQKIKDKAYRYFSPEFMDKWKHPASGIEFKDVLFGGALTNRPFLKGIQPVNLSEFSRSQELNDDNTPGGDEMAKRETLELMATLHSVEFDDKTSDEDLQAALAAKVTAPSTPAGEGGSGGTPPGETPPAPSSLTPAMASELAKLSEENSVVAALLTDRAEQAKRIAALEASTRMNEVRMQLTKTASEKYALSPVAHQRLSEVLVTVPKELGDKIVDAVSLIVQEGGLVRLGEYGGSTDKRDRDATVEFEKQVQKKLTEDKDLDYASAVSVVATEDPELFEAHRRASYIDSEV